MLVNEQSSIEMACSIESKMSLHNFAEEAHDDEGEGMKKHEGHKT